MKFLVALVVLLSCSAVFAALPSRSSLRFNEIKDDHISPRSISEEKLQYQSVGTNQLQTFSVTNDKLESYSVDDRVLKENSVTARSAAIDKVRIYFGEGEDGEALKPRNTAIGNVPGDIVYHNPTLQRAYRVDGRAKGPGVILGWYPNQNGHMLRYQADRALRQLQCGFSFWHYWDSYIGCSTGCVGDDDDDTRCGTSCGIVWFTHYWTNSLQGYCGNDPWCSSYYYFPYYLHIHPDNCIAYTSTQDINDPQEGTPVYSPSIERIVIDDEGLVSVYYMGKGIPINASERANGVRQPEIDITVVVLLNNQFGP